MHAQSVVHNPDHSITVSVTFKPGASMLESEQALQNALNVAGCLGTAECLKNFDTDGAPIIIGGKKWTAIGRRPLPKIYETPYGKSSVERYVYQSSSGGATYCPMEHNARIVRIATPLLAKQVAFKYAHNDATEVVQDFAQHGRKMDRSHVREIASDVSSISGEKESCFTYDLPQLPAGQIVRTITVGTDGASALFCQGEGYRQVMVGTIAFYNEEGERLHTIYLANSPERGKGSFFEKMERELKIVRKHYPNACYVGIADGAHDQWEWLKRKTDWQILDFWHASEYINAVAPAFAKDEPDKKAWAEQACHDLKHEKGAAGKLLRKLKKVRKQKLAKKVLDEVNTTVTYLENQMERMNYNLYISMGFPIGSGVTEAACKTIVKARLCGTGMRWQLDGAQRVLSLRTLVKSEGRWEAFWKKTAAYGFSKITRTKRPSAKKKN
jgi:hypothetical protein